MKKMTKSDYFKLPEHLKEIYPAPNETTPENARFKSFELVTKISKRLKNN